MHAAGDVAAHSSLWLAIFVFDALSQPVPLLGHFQQHRFFAHVVARVREPQALGGIAAILPRSAHAEFPPRSQGNAARAELVPASRTDLIRNFAQKFHVSITGIWTTKVDGETILVTIMDEIEKYRQYAAECRRLAEKSSAKDKAILLEIADAWIACADGALRLHHKRGGNPPGH